MCFCLKKNQVKVSCEELESLNFSNQLAVFPTNPNELMVFCGFEIPRYTRPLIKRILRRLKKEKMVSFSHDDGMGVIVHQELKLIADALSIPFYEKEHEILLYLEDKIPEYVY
jgi:hypothetical protein